MPCTLTLNTLFTFVLHAFILQKNSIYFQLKDLLLCKIHSQDVELWYVTNQGCQLSCVDRETPHAIFSLSEKQITAKRNTDSVRTDRQSTEAAAQRLSLSSYAVHTQAGVRMSYYGYGHALSLCHSETLSQFPITAF